MTEKRPWPIRVLLWILMLPLNIVKAIIDIIKETFGHVKKVGKSRRTANYEKFSIIKAVKGNFDDWEEKIQEGSTISIILGARGSGKSALGIKMLENVHAKKNSRCFALGFGQKELPSWITAVENVTEIMNDSFVLLDEGGIFFSSRKSMSTVNKVLSDLILISRHKNLNIIFISQNSSNLDVNILRQADCLLLKRSSLLQKDFERKKIKELYEAHMAEFEKLKDDKGLVYIHADSFQGFVSNPLPSFWSTGLSKSFK